ncbi:class I SAM-dependent methyltransferase [Aliamphritea spongicola]|nr:hypothetical protein [Aliamphritea spongicola]
MPPGSEQDSMQAVFDYIEQQFTRRPGEVGRLFHGRGRCFSGFEDVVIDRLPPLIVIRLFNQIPAEQLDNLVAFLQNIRFTSHPHCWCSTAIAVKTAFRCAGRRMMRMSDGWQ